MELATAGKLTLDRPLSKLAAVITSDEAQSVKSHFSPYRQNAAHWPIPVPNGLSWMRRRFETNFSVDCLCQATQD
jgi:hypothetical protein